MDAHAKHTLDFMKGEQSDYHVPIMLQQVVQALCRGGGGVYFDGTLGGGGHTRTILDAHPLNRVVATDLDDDAIANARQIEDSSSGRLVVQKSNFKDVCDVLDRCGVHSLDGALLDLGISSHQIDCAERGFSYRYDARLDMRMDRTQELDAFKVVNTFSSQQICDILKIYGEEKFARQIANTISKHRQQSKIQTTGQLVEIIRQCIPYHKSNGHPAKKTFQALRIFVNSELSGLDKALIDIVGRLKAGARLCVISFHSLEDRIVKNVFSNLSKGCVCHKRLPICVCGNQPTTRLMQKIVPSPQELAVNQRAKSAILRICEKIS